MEIPDNFNKKASLAAAVGVGAFATYQIFYPGSFFRQWWNDINRPWVKVGTLRDIMVFPLKSGAPLEVKNAKCTIYGLQTEGGARDRHMSIIDTNQNNRYINVRGSGRMLLLHLDHYRKSDGRIILKLSVLDNSNDMPQPLEIDLEKVKGQETNVRVWTEEHVLSAYDLGDAAIDWVRKALRMDEKETGGWRLVWHNPGMFNKRDINKLPDILSIYPLLRTYVNHKPMFANNMPYMMTTSASLNDLEKRLNDVNEPVNEMAKRIRPNLVVKTDANIPPYDEDNWCEIRVGQPEGNPVRLACVAWCGRCLNTTYDPVTGERHPKGEPLNMMTRYRPKEPYKKHHPPIFGVNCAVRDNQGTVHVGDVVYARYGPIVWELSVEFLLLKPVYIPTRCCCC